MSKKKDLQKIKPPKSKKLKKKFKRKVKTVMKEYKEGELDIGKSTKKVKSRKQAVAVALSVAKKAVSKKKKKSSRS